MIPLHVQGAVQAFGIREGRGIEQHHAVVPVAVRRTGQPLGAICLNLHMGVAGEAVECEIAPCPRQVAGGQVDAGGSGGIAGSGLDRGCAGVGEQIQKPLSRRQAPDKPANLPMVEEQTGIHSIMEVDQ